MIHKMNYIILFEQFEKVKKKRYFHGSGNATGEEIIKCGYIKPGNVDKKRGSKLTPMIGRTYMTPLIREACIYGIGGILMGKKIDKDGFGYVFEMNTKNLKLLADEDYIGMAVYLCATSPDYYKKEPEKNIVAWDSHQKNTFLHYAKTNLTQLQYLKCVRYDDYADFAVAGKKLAKILPEYINQWLIDAGVPVSVEGNVKIKHAWRVNLREDVIKLKDDGRNFFKIAEKLF